LVAGGFAGLGRGRLGLRQIGFMDRLGRTPLDEPQGFLAGQVDHVAGVVHHAIAASADQKFHLHR
jgi:hypothetical protein